MPGYIYAQRDEDLYVNLYISSHSTFSVDGREMTLRQESRFPWSGEVSLSVEAEQPLPATLKLRIPGYVRNRPVPSDLYTYLDDNDREIPIRLNDEEISYTLDEQGYVNLNRTWQNGDRIEIDFPLEVEIVRAHPGVTANQSKIAFERGPLLYCAEWADNPDGKVLSLIVDEKSDFSTQESDILSGIYTIKGQAKRAARQLDGSVAVSESAKLTLIPYHLWNNRGPGEMSVWLPTSLESTRPEPAPTIARTSEVSASISSRAIVALNDQLLPAHSNDHSISYFHWWPKKDSREWVQFDFAQDQEVSSVQAYWFDDGPSGGCRIPAGWEVQYRDGDEWKPVEASGPYPVTKDAPDRIQFKPVRTPALRIVVDLPQEYATGLYEVIIE
jgi:hypothetical protein